ncbi:MAG: kpsM protein [Burkholderiales bacterium PBB6]|nr:MAG: kpsM protein [Burkholderiales bacterium PBB6]
MKRRSSWQIQKAVVFALLMREIKTRFGGNLAGVVWVLGAPLLQLAVLVWINTMLRGRLTRGSFEFPLFLLIGMMPYQLFKGLWVQVMNSVSANHGLFGFKQVKPMDTMVARTVLETCIDCLVLAVAMALLGRIGYAPVVPLDAFAVMATILLLVLLGMGLGVLSAVIVEVLPRWQLFVQLLAMPLYLLSGIIFSVHGFSQDMVSLLLWNPVLHLVELCRAAWLPGYSLLPGVNWTLPLAWVIGVWTLALNLYWLRRRNLVMS